VHILQVVNRKLSSVHKVNAWEFLQILYLHCYAYCYAFIFNFMANIGWSMHALGKKIYIERIMVLIKKIKCCQMAYRHDKGISVI
jgi:hypothetical protein